MLLMNLADIEGDRRVGRITLAAKLGPERAILGVALGYAVAYGLMLLLMCAHVLALPVAVAMLLTLPVPLRLLREVHGGALQQRANPREVAGAGPGNGMLIARTASVWASTHVALLAAAATVGLWATRAPPATP